VNWSGRVFSTHAFWSGGQGVRASPSLHGASMWIVHKNSYIQKVIEKFGKDPRRLHFLSKNWLIDESFVFHAKLHSCKISLIQTLCSKIWESAEWKFNETKDEMIFPEILNYPSLDLWQVDDDSARTSIAVLRKQELESSNFASDNRERG